MIDYTDLTDWDYCNEAFEDDEAYVIDGQLTERARTVYSNGECWYLAWVLHQITGWEVLAISHVEDVSAWSHLAVRTPDGQTLDITGVSTDAQIAGRWGMQASAVYTLDVQRGMGSIEELHAFFSATIDPYLIPVQMHERTVEVARVLLAQAQG